MSTFDKHISNDRIIALVCGDNGAGKTSLFASLVNAGYEVFIQDFDNGLDVLRNRVDPENYSKLHYITPANEASAAWNNARSLLKNGWKDEEEDFGKLTTWGPDRVLGIDTLTFLGKDIMKTILKGQGKEPFAKSSLPDWGDASRLMEWFIDKLTRDNNIKCHIVMMTHTKPIEFDDGITKLYPVCVGTALPMNVGTYFNNIWRVRTKTLGNAIKRTIRTQSDNTMELKHSGGDDVLADEEPDLGALFQKILGNG